MRLLNHGQGRRGGNGGGAASLFGLQGYEDGQAGPGRQSFATSEHSADGLGGRTRSSIGGIGSFSIATDDPPFGWEHGEDMSNLRSVFMHEAETMRGSLKGLVRSDTSSIGAQHWCNVDTHPMGVAAHGSQHAQAQERCGTDRGDQMPTALPFATAQMTGSSTYQSSMSMQGELETDSGGKSSSKGSMRRTRPS